MTVLLNHKIVHHSPYSPLHELEADVLVSVAERFVEKYPESSRNILRGSFRLIGYPRVGDPQEIFSFDFPGGTDIGHPDCDSYELVNHAIDRAIADFNTVIPTTIDNTRQNNHSETLVLQAKYGRFILGIAMVPRDLGRSFLLQIATTIKQLGFSSNSDRTLAFSIESLHVSGDDRDELFRLESELWGNYFSSPEMQKWQHWHRLHPREKGELGFFFEESIRNERATSQNRYTQPLTQPVIKLRA